MTGEDELPYGNRPPLAHRKCKTLISALVHCSNAGLPDPWKKYCENRNAAKKRKLDWTLSFDDWWSLWKDHFHLRGLGAGKMNLCRNGDAGGYHIGNVRIDTCEANQLEMLATHARRAAEAKEKRAAAKTYQPKRTAVNRNSTHEWGEQSMGFADPLEILLAKEAINAL